MRGQEYTQTGGCMAVVILTCDGTRLGVLGGGCLTGNPAKMTTIAVGTTHPFYELIRLNSIFSSTVYFPSFQ